jgi:protein TonB
VRPQVAQKPPRVPPSTRVPESPTAAQANPADQPATQPTSRSVSAEAPIANDWRHSLASWFAAHKTYPQEARREGAEGNVVLQFTADRSGRVIDVVLVRSAGSALLDAAAVSMVRHATLPAFTAGMSQDSVTVTVQMHYALTD